MKKRQRILIVDDTPGNIRLLNDLLRGDYDISVATNGPDAIEICHSLAPPDLILLDIMMPGMDGYEVCQRLKAHEKTRRIPILFVTARSETDDETKGLQLGAVDYITKPVRPPIVQARVKNHIALFMYQERLEETVAMRTEQLRKGYEETVHRLVLASEFKDEETGAHIKRISYYTRELSLVLGMGARFAETIFHASPMHDIGKVAIPDAILLKEGPLTPDEWAVMMTHTTVGAKILQGSDSPYLRMAEDIAWCHHERWDGHGYPRGLKGEEIPFTARIMSITDQYDALRSKRPYKTSIPHEQAVAILTRGDERTHPDHFDPDVLNAFIKSSDLFAEIFDTHTDKP